jgi:hypothetical protein
MPVSAYHKFNAGIALLLGPANLIGSGGTTADLLIAYLTNLAPDLAADVNKADLAEITPGNGYAGPIPLNNEGTRTGGTVTVTAESFLITATGVVPPFRYIPIADDTLAGDPLLSWFDYGSEVNLIDTQTFELRFNGAPAGSDGTLFTAA